MRTIENALVKALKREYPEMCETMIETLVQSYEKGTLSKYLDEWEEVPENSLDKTLIGNITIESPEEKSLE